MNPETVDLPESVKSYACSAFSLVLERHGVTAPLNEISPMSVTDNDGPNVLLKWVSPDVEPRRYAEGRFYPNQDRSGGTLWLYFLRPPNYKSAVVLDTTRRDYFSGSEEGFPGFIPMSAHSSQ